MLTLLRRLFWLGLIGGAGYAGWTLWQRQAAPTPAAAPEWPRLPPRDDAADPAPPPEAHAPSEVPASESGAGHEQRWAAPVDGACPHGFPIKANANSGIFHVPGGRFYDRTVPERCYADRADAEADGYRAAKA